MGAQRRRNSLVVNRSTLASHAETHELGTASVTASVDQEQGMAAMMGGTIATSDKAPIRDSPGAILRERVWKWCELVRMNQLRRASVSPLVYTPSVFGFLMSLRFPAGGGSLRLSRLLVL